MSNLNTSGFKVPEYRILILPDIVEEKTSGGIILPETAREDLQGAKTLATIIDIGEKSFDQGTEREWKSKPMVGDKILIPSYEGYRLSKDQTKDGREYRIILDRHILAIKTSEETCQ
jgi:chaperonin GroES